MMQRLQMFLIALSVLAALVMVGCGPDNSQKRGKINTTRTNKGGAPSNGLNAESPLTGAGGVNQKNVSIAKVQGTEMIVPAPQVATAQQITGRIQELFSAAKVLTVNDLLPGNYQLIEVRHLLLNNNGQDAASHRMTLAQKDGGLSTDFSDVLRTQNGLNKTWGPAHVQSLVTSFQLTKDGVKVLAGINYVSQDVPGRLIVKGENNPNATLRLAELASAKVDKGAYILVDTKQIRQSVTFRGQGEVVMISLTNQEGTTGRYREVILIYKFEKETAATAATPAAQTPAATAAPATPATPAATSAPATTAAATSAAPVAEKPAAAAEPVKKPEAATPEPSVSELDPVGAGLNN